MSEGKVKVIDLFSGVGGLSLGAARAGCHVALAIENDRQTLAAHRRNFRVSQHMEADVSMLNTQDLRQTANVTRDEPIAVVGGPPCQGFSTMGHRCAKDPRNQLFVAFFKIVRDIQPVFFLAENVPGIMNAENEEVRNYSLSLVSGDYELLPPVRVIANEFGVPTIRSRYLFVGYKNDYFDNMSSDMFDVRRKRIRVGEALFGLPTRIRSDWQSERQSWRCVVYPDSESAFWRAIRSRVPKGVGDPNAIRLLAENQVVSGFLGTAHSTAVKERFSRVKPGQVDKISKARRLEWDGYCPTLRAGTGAERGSYQAVRPLHPSAHRVITPREAARLQGFPDWFQFSPTKWHSFRQIGNSVCPILAEVVLRKILNKQKK